MMDGLNEKLRFTIEEAAELGLGSLRQIRYMIKRGDIQCIPPWIEGGKRQKRWIHRSELVRVGILPPLVEVGVKLSAAQVLKLKDMEKHLTEIYRLKKTLESNLWLPPLSYLPSIDLFVQSDTYNTEHIINWTSGVDGSPIIKLPVEDQDNFVYLKQHTEGLEFWQHLPEWKQIGGRYIYHRSILLQNILEDIKKDTGLPIMVKEAERGVLEGFSWVIFRNLFPQVSQNEKKAKLLAEKAITLASEGCWSEAVEANKNIIKMFPNSLDALKRLGKAQMELQRCVFAKEAYSRALEIDPYDLIAQKILKELLQKYPDGNGIARIDGGRYRVVAKWPNLWLIAVFTDDGGENIASVYPTEVDSIVKTFQNLLRKYRLSDEVKAILELRKEIDQLERSLFQKIKRVTLRVIAESKCDGCPI
jgi:tetratricopeptide (TPR) repeat protein